MKKSHVYISIFILILLLSVPIIVNTGLRCSRYIISEGDSKYNVSQKINQCGEVLNKEVMTSGDGNIKSEQWFVKINRRCYQILFVNGVVRDISKGERCL